MIKINLQKFIWSIIIFVLIVILIQITPFYNRPINKTLETKAQIIIYSTKSLTKSEWFISIESKTKENIKIENWLKYLPFNIKSWQKIIFATKETYYDSYIFIQITWNIIKIYPQSAIYITNPEDKIKITIINWTVQYLNLNQSNPINFEWPIKPINLDNNDTILNKIKQDQNNRQKEYIINLYWWSILSNRTFDYIIHNLIIILSKISPNNFKDNLNNYNDFKQYINKTDQPITWNQLNFRKNEKTEINQDIIKQIKKWWSKIINSF